MVEQVRQVLGTVLLRVDHMIPKQQGQVAHPTPD
jgi:hypothetical protein